MPISIGDTSRTTPPSPAQLNDLTKKKRDFKWSEEHQEAFKKLKAAVTSAPALKNADPYNNFVVTTDASGYAIGAVLQQQFKGKLHPVVFVSRKLNPAETRYVTHERETLAVIHALKKWQPYLLGKKT